MYLEIPRSEKSGGIKCIKTHRQRQGVKRVETLWMNYGIGQQFLKFNEDKDGNKS